VVPFCAMPEGVLRRRASSVLAQYGEDAAAGHAADTNRDDGPEVDLAIVLQYSCGCVHGLQ
jgi:hypothetical protein